MTLCALAIAGSSLLSPLTLNLMSTEAHACLPEQLPDPILISATNDDGSIPLGSDIVLKVDGSFDETDAVVSVNGEEVEAAIEMKRIFLASMVHVSLPEELAEGDEITLVFPNAWLLFGEDPEASLFYTAGEAIEASTTELAELNFDLIERSEEDFNSCDGYAQQTRFFVGGTNLDVEWLYADFVVGGERTTRLIRPTVEDGVLEIPFNHERLEDMDISERSAGVSLYDVHGRAFSIRTIGGCRRLTQIEAGDTPTYDERERNEEGCGLGAGDYTEAMPSFPEEPLPDNPEDTDTGDEDETPTDSDEADAEDPDSEADSEADMGRDAGDVEESGGCEQNKTSRATSLYLLGLAGLMSLFSRRRRRDELS